MLSILSSSACGLIVILLQTQADDHFGFWDVISWIVVGLIAGVLAKIIMPGKDPGGCAITMLLGIGGAVLAGFLARHLLAVKSTGTFSTGFFARVGLGVVGAIIILAIYRLIAGRRA
ncbi:MAG TPA: GlsB/YeaQ/YmgE family stress response membrane protein [Pyrinomonadaceae bacterium]|nr:GlsB/YeaQ/YmgE family stress response membrane protein [Pyrinomonadaceae bacterium]